jgi:hypothetical protein
VATGRLAAQVVFGAATLSAGWLVVAAALSSVKRGKPKSVAIKVLNSVSKFKPVELSRPLEKFVFPSQIQFKNPPVEARTVLVS